jgi:hypothetical protein
MSTASKAPVVAIGTFFRLESHLTQLHFKEAGASHII